MKRFYKLVSLYDKDGMTGIQLDGKPVKTPAKKELLVKDKHLANLILQEWFVQEKEIIPDKMPVNQFVMTSIDKVREREQQISHILGFIDTDLVFYRSESEPYKTKQEEVWGKWIKWTEQELSVRFKTTEHIESLEQDAAITQKFAEYLSTLNDLELTVFETLIDETSSPVLAYAFSRKAATVNDLYQAVLVEDLIRAEIYDEEKYGAAPDQVKKRESLQRNLSAAEQIISLRG